MPGEAPPGSPPFMAPPVLTLGVGVTPVMAVLIRPGVHRQPSGTARLPTAARAVVLAVAAAAAAVAVVAIAMVAAVAVAAVGGGAPPAPQLLSSQQRYRPRPLPRVRTVGARDSTHKIEGGGRRG